MRHFYLSHLVTLIGLALAYFWAGAEGLAVAFLLMVLEVSLSFDNAVVNAAVLEGMDAKWQRRFLTWGMLVAVFGMRLLFPLLIVALATGVGLLEVAHMAFAEPARYSAAVRASHINIASFGGVFLLMVFLHFLFDETKHIHWLGVIERKLARVGKLESVEVVVALAALLALQAWLPAEARNHSLMSGVVGVVLYVLTNSITALFSHDDAHRAAYAGVTGFFYLQLLDASFSLDGVVGAFAISDDIVIIMLGLGIGAMFVRSLTLYLVHKGTLTEYVFLEHGAHYGIGALAVLMLVSTVYHVSELITGLIGVAFIGLSLISSIRYRRRIALLKL